MKSRKPICKVLLTLNPIVKTAAKVRKSVVKVLVIFKESHNDYNIILLCIKHHTARYPQIVVESKAAKVRMQLVKVLVKVKELNLPNDCEAHESKETSPIGGGDSVAPMEWTITGHCPLRFTGL